MPLFVNGVEISDEAVFAEMQYHPATSAIEAQEKAARALAIRELLIQEARRLKIAPPNRLNSEEVEEDYLISRLLETEVVTPEVDVISCRRYYDQNQQKFRDKEGNLVRFEFVQSSIEAFLSETSWQVAVRQYLKILAGQAEVAGVDLEAAASPLVQ